jgi:hypothetical protein
VPELQRLRAGHAPAVLAFELANRAYFAASVSDRGDEFYDQFTERHNALLAAQEAGTGAFYLLVAGDGSVLGRFNLYLCVPKTSSRSCDQAVLVDQASGVGLPSDAVPAEIDRFGQGFQRRSGVQ